jgi:hypothetical protein
MESLQKNIKINSSSKGGIKDTIVMDLNVIIKNMLPFSKLFLNFDYMSNSSPSHTCLLQKVFMDFYMW